MDWEKCPAVESVPGKLGGAWVFTDTSQPVSALFGNLAEGATVEEFMDWFAPVDEWKVRAVLEFVADSLKAPLPVSSLEDTVKGKPVPGAGASEGETEAERRRRLLRELFASFDSQGIRSPAFGNLTRAEVHDRKRARAEAAVEAWLTEQEREPQRG